MVNMMLYMYYMVIILNSYLMKVFTHYPCHLYRLKTVNLKLRQA